MKLDQYLASLLPAFTKERVLEDCRMTSAELKETAIPLYDTAVKAFKGHKFKNEQVLDMQTVFGRVVKGHGGGLLVGVQSALEQTLKNLDEIESMVDRVYSEEVAGVGMTYLKANLLQFTEWCSFVSKYSRRLLIYTLILETSEYPDSGPTLSESLEEAEVEWLKGHFVHFCTAVNAVAQPTDKIKSAIANIPDINITKDNYESLKSTMGEAKIDPFSVGLIPIWLNPIYHVRMAVAEWRADRYRGQKEEKKVVELRILNLKRMQENKPDARVQKEIDYSQTRLSKINHSLEMMERRKNG